MQLTSTTQPLSYSQLLLRGFKLYTKAFGHTFILAFLLSLVIFTPRLIAAAVGQTIFTGPFWRGPFLFLFLAIYLASLWFFAAIYWHMHCVAIGKRETYVEDFKTAGKKIFYLFCAALLIFLITGAVVWIDYQLHLLLLRYNVLFQKSLFSTAITFSVLLLQAGFSFMISMLFFFYFPLIVIENDKTLLALKQSVLLVWGNVWRVFSVQFTPWLLYLLLINLLEIIFRVNIHVFFVPANQVSSLPTVIMHLIIFALFIPWSIATMIMQVQDLELRKAGATRHDVRK